VGQFRSPAPAHLQSREFCSPAKEGCYERFGYRCGPGSDVRRRLTAPKPNLCEQGWLECRWFQRDLVSANDAALAALGIAAQERRTAADLN
jgi:hypothetical protein